jgi:carbon-monoxide dehydrogenase small subunit
MKKKEIHLEINGEDYTLEIYPNRTLLEVLREDLGLTGTKEGCSEGVCGSCTVLLNGNPVRSCLVLTAEQEGARVITVEGLAQGEILDPLQESFIQHGAVQCGFCTPGMLMTAKAFLKENPSPTEREVRQALSGNICRCTGYAKIAKAVVEAPK